MVVRDEITDEYVGLKCDSCATMAPPAEEIARGHGLINMGWHCSGGTHLCPEHAAEGPSVTTTRYRTVANGVAQV